MMYLVPLVLVLAVFAAPFVAERMRKPMDDAARAKAGGEFATLSQGVTHYRWLGPLRGPVAVCVHGLTMPSFVWLGLAQGLAALGYRVLIYDLYGRGYSDRAPGPQDSAFFIRQLDDLLADQNVTDDFTLIGYSMGGSVATAFAAAQPGRLRQLVLIASGGLGGAPQGLMRRALAIPLIGDWLFYVLFPRRLRKEAGAQRALPGSAAEIVDRQLQELDVRGYLPAVLASLRGIASRPMEPEHRAVHQADLPVLAIWGRDDDIVPLSAQGRLAQWSRNARQDVVRGAGHGLIFTHTDAVLQSMTEALRDGLG